MAASNTSKTYLYMSSDGSTYTKICDIKNYPDLGGEPELLETTTLSDTQHTYIPGIDGVGDNLDFTANFDKTDFNTIKGYAGTEYYIAVGFGGSGAYANVDCKFTFKGYINVYMNGGDVNAVREMTITITPTTVIGFTAS